MCADSKDNGFTTLGSTFDVSPNETSDVPAPSVNRTAMLFELLILQKKEKMKTFTQMKTELPVCDCVYAYNSQMLMAYA